MPEEREHDDPLIREVAQATLYCAACGYDLTGISSAICPECGASLNWTSCDSITARHPHGFSSRTKRTFRWLWDHIWLVMLIGFAALIFAIWWLTRFGDI